MAARLGASSGPAHPISQRPAPRPAGECPTKQPRGVHCRQQLAPGERWGLRQTGPRAVGRCESHMRCMSAAASAPPTEAGIPKQTLPNGLRCAYVSKNDLDFLFNEVYVKRAYLRNGISLSEGNAVLDVGGNIGMFAIQAAEICGGDGSVVTAEPIPNTFEALRYNLASHGGWCAAREKTSAQVTALNVGVSNGSQSEAAFTFYPRAAGWSTLSPDPKGVMSDMLSFLDASLNDRDVGIPNSILVRVGRFLQRWVPFLYRMLATAVVWTMLLDRQTVRCPLKTVSQIIQEQGLSEVDLLKIDVERAELEVLQGVNREDWRRIRQVVLEVHDEDGRMEEVTAILAGAGFTSIVVEQDEALQSSRLYNLYCTRS